MAVGWQQLLIVLILVLVLFGGRGKISGLMGEVAKGIKSFRQGMRDDDDEARASAAETSTPRPELTAERTETVPQGETQDRKTEA